MLSLQYWKQELPFQYPFTIAKGTKTHQPSLVVSLQQGALKGYGEAPAISYYDVTVEGMIAQLQAKQAMLQRYALTEPMRFWHFLHHLLPGQHFLIAALDIAAWDLFAKRSARPLYKALQIAEVPPVLTDYTLGHSDKETLLEKIKAHPWPVYKIKMTAAEDIDLICFVRSHTHADIRVDANECLHYEDTLKLIPELQQLGVTLLEQPLPKTAWEEMKALKGQSTIPLIADESCVTEDDVAACAEAFDGINIKLTKCGGITPALRMIHHARQKELKVMLGSMNESSVGTAAMVHLSPLADYLDADGPLLLKDVVCKHLYYREGYLHLQDSVGLGEAF